MTTRRSLTACEGVINQLRAHSALRTGPPVGLTPVAQDARRWTCTLRQPSALILLERVCYLQQQGVPFLLLNTGERTAEISVTRTLRALDEFISHQRQVLRFAGTDQSKAEAFALLAGAAAAELRIEFEHYCAPRLFELVPLAEVFLQSRRLRRLFQKGYRAQVRKVYSDDVIPQVHFTSLRNRQRFLQEFARLFPAHLAAERPQSTPLRSPRGRFWSFMPFMR